MSKIICDVCGTAYHENATQCPICGCVRPGEVVTASVTADTTEPTSTYTYVKGGRFSKGNVKKRAQGKEVREVKPAGKPEETKEEKKAGKGMIIAIAVLLIAIIAVVIYIGLHLGNRWTGAGSSFPETTGEQTVDTTEATDLQIPCTGVIPARERITFEKAGAAVLLDVELMPTDTTDQLQFSSSDESVVTVSEKGKITAVRRGDAVITITCGDATAECRITCNFEGEATETTAPTETEYDESDLKLTKEDITMNTKGQTAKIYTGDIPADKITWTTDDALVAKFDGGVVTAVGAGTTTVHGQYGDIKVSCIVRCLESMGKAEPQQESDGKYQINKTDVTIAVDETFSLTLADASGKTVSVSWTVGNGSVCSVDGNTVKGLSSGKTEVSGTYEGETYTCIVRVKS